jgi:hypothetical protein
VFKKGDRVRLSEFGKITYCDRPNNPHDEVGVVIGVSRFPPFFACWVMWDCGGINAYDVVELEHSDIPDIPLEQMLKECLG